MKEPKTDAVEYVNKIDVSQIPEHVLRRLAEVVYKAVLRNIQKPKFREEYERWKAEQQSKGEPEQTDSE